MEASIVHFLDSLGSLAFRLAAVCFVVVNGAALAAFAVSRSRRLVDEWTPRLVSADVLLLAGGLGIPLLAALAKVGVRAVASLYGGGAAPIK